MVRAYQIFLVLMKIDFFFTVLFCAQQVFVVLGFGDYETYLCIAALPVFLAVWFVIVYALRNEKKVLTVGFILLVSLGFVYFLYKARRPFLAPAAARGADRARPPPRSSSSTSGPSTSRAASSATPRSASSCSRRTVGARARPRAES